MKKKISFFLLVILIILIFFNKKIFEYLLIKNISIWTEYEVYLKISELNYLDGIVEISNIELKNQKKFFNENIFESKKIFISIDYKSIFSELVIFNKIIFFKPKFYFEVKDINQATNKLKNFIDNFNLIENLSKKKKSPKIYPKKKKDKNFIILDLQMKNSEAFIKYPFKRENINIKLSKMSFKKVGNAGKKGEKSFQHYKDVLNIILVDTFYRIKDNNIRKFLLDNYKIRKKNY